MRRRPGPQPRARARAWNETARRRGVSFPLWRQNRWQTEEPLTTDMLIVLAALALALLLLAGWLLLRRLLLAQWQAGLRELDDKALAPQLVSKNQLEQI